MGIAPGYEGFTPKKGKSVIDSGFLRFVVRVKQVKYARGYLMMKSTVALGRINLGNDMVSVEIE